MKKLVLTSVCTLALAGAAFAQGTLNWSAPTASAFTLQTNSTAYSPLFGGGNPSGGSIGSTAPSSAGYTYYFELLYTAYSGSPAAQPTTLGQLATWGDSGLEGQNNATFGRTQANNSNTAAVVPWASGTTDSVMAVIWSSNLGTTWSAALAALQADTTANAFLGLSTVGFLSPNVAPANGAVVFGNNTTVNGQPINNSLSTQLYLVPVPEPSTIAMAAFGGLSLLALRRKK